MVLFCGMQGFMKGSSLGFLGNTGLALQAVGKFALASCDFANTWRAC